MSTRRIQEDRGWVDQKDLPKGPNGRNLCRRCNVEVPKGRLTFCSDACVHEWKIRTNPGYVRQEIYKRDRGVCILCGAKDKNKWDADHIVPVVEGGGECGIDGYRTLCKPCHKTVTAELRARLAEARKKEKNK